MRKYSDYLNKAKFLSKNEREEIKEIKELQIAMEMEKSKIESKRNEKAESRIHSNPNGKSHNLINSRESNNRRRSRSNSKEKQKNRNKNSKIIKKEFKDEGELIKATYLGTNKDKKRLLKPSEKFKNIFNFGWDDSEDTFSDLNPIYSERLDPKILFGKGRLGGLEEFKDKKIEDHKQVEKISDLSKQHWSQKASDEMTERDWRIFREDNDIRIKGGRVPVPFRDWEPHLLPPNLFRAVKQANYKTPTPIQMQAIPIGLARKDMIGIAPTGSGKSAAFLIPLIAFLQTLPPLDELRGQDGPYAIILLPTRELALQIDNEFKKFSRETKLRSTVVVGGRSISDQSFSLRIGTEVVIGTPGRIKDTLETRSFVLNQCYWVILDEADKMIDLGLEEDVNFILDSIPSDNLKSHMENEAINQEISSIKGEKIYRVTHLFSATMPAEIEKIAKLYLRSYCFISIGQPGSAKKDIEQRFEFTTEQEKRFRSILFRKLLTRLLNDLPFPVILFANTKNKVDEIGKYLQNQGIFRVIVYHGGKMQDVREAAVDGFKSSLTHFFILEMFDILVATPLAARGLDIEDVQVVINIDSPKNMKEFIHQTGRTGRAGKKGIAITFFTDGDEEIFYDLNQFLLENKLEIPKQLADHPLTKIKTREKIQASIIH